MEVETEAKVDEPFEKYVKQVEVKPFDNVSAEVKKYMNADVIVIYIYIYIQFHI